MIKTTVGHIADVTGARIVVGDPARACHGCVIDSRSVGEDGVFVAFPGERVDGNEFAPQALESGAAAVVLTREPSEGLVRRAGELGAAVLVADDPEAFLQDLASDYRGRLDCVVVGVTGSVGKTSTKDMLAAVLGTSRRVHATAGNFNNLLGLPLTVLAAPEDAQVLVLEMGMNARGEISTLTRIARPDFGVVTKIGTSHIGMLGSREAIADAKAEMLEGMEPSCAEGTRPSSALFLTAEDDFTPYISEKHAAPRGVDVVLVGRSERAAVRAENVSLDGDGRPSFDVVAEGVPRFRVELALTGEHSVSNALLAVAVALRLGTDPADIAGALSSMKATHMRQEQVEAACGARIIDDSYNASPDSCAAALDVLLSLPCDGRRIAVLGEIGELGDEACRLHGLVGAYVAAKRPDLLVCVGGDDARSMADAARLMGMPEGAVLVAATAEDALALAGGSLRAGDLVLVKGSRSVGLDKFVKGVCKR